MLGRGQQVERRVEELRDVVDARHRHVRAAARALRRPDEALRRQQAERLADRRAADAELTGQHGLVRQPLAAHELARDDQVAELVGHLLVRLADAPDGHRVRRPLDRPERRGGHAGSIPNSALPAIETGALYGTSPSRKYSVSELPSRAARSSPRFASVAAASISSVRSSAKTTP